MFTEPKKSGVGLFIVDWQENFVHWLAWREWLWEMFEKRFFPQNQTVTMAWPPETGAGATAFSFWLQQIREEVAKEKRVDGGGPCKAIPQIVLPWRGWSPDLKADVARGEAKRREEWGRSFSQAPTYPVKARQGWRYPSPLANSGEVTALSILQRKRQQAAE